MGQAIDRKEGQSRNWPSLLTPFQLAIFIAAVLTVFFYAEAAFADPFNAFLRQYKDSVRAHEDAIYQQAKRLFWILAVIQLSWWSIQSFIAGEGMQQWVAGLIRQVMFIGFFAFLLEEGPDLLGTITDSLIKVAELGSGGAGVGGINSPGAIWNVIGDVITQIWANAESDSIFQEAGLYIVAAIASIMVTLMLGFAMLALFIGFVEIYIVILAGTLLLGFGGSQMTSNFVTSMLRGIFQVGLKLMITMLIITIGINFITTEVLNTGGHSGFVMASAGFITGCCFIVLVSFLTGYMAMNAGALAGVLMGGGGINTSGGAMGAASSAMGAVAGAGNRIATAARTYGAASQAKAQGHSGISPMAQAARAALAPQSYGAAHMNPYNPLGGQYASPPPAPRSNSNSEGGGASSPSSQVARAATLAGAQAGEAAGATAGAAAAAAAPNSGVNSLPSLASLTGQSSAGGQSGGSGNASSSSGGGSSAGTTSGGSATQGGNGGAATSTAGAAGGNDSSSTNSTNTSGSNSGGSAVPPPAAGSTINQSSAPAVPPRGDPGQRGTAGRDGKEGDLGRQGDVGKDGSMGQKGDQGNTPEGQTAASPPPRSESSSGTVTPPASGGSGASKDPDGGVTIADVQSTVNSMLPGSSGTSGAGNNQGSSAPPANPPSSGNTSPPPPSATPPPSGGKNKPKDKE